MISRWWESCQIRNEQKPKTKGRARTPCYCLICYNWTNISVLKIKLQSCIYTDSKFAFERYELHSRAHAHGTTDGNYILKKYVCFRHEFLRETSWLAGLRDPNLARVVGLCSQDEPMCSLQEHSEPGELPRFLAQRVAEDDSQSPTIR